jgi:hypothetical protein
LLEEATVPLKSKNPHFLAALFFSSWDNDANPFLILRASGRTWNPVTGRKTTPVSTQTAN